MHARLNDNSILDNLLTKRELNNQSLNIINTIAVQNTIAFCWQNKISFAAHTITLPHNASAASGSCTILLSK